MSEKGRKQEYIFGAKVNIKPCAHPRVDTVRKLLLLLGELCAGVFCTNQYFRPSAGLLF